MRWAVGLVLIATGCAMNVQELPTQPVDRQTERVLRAADLYAGLEATRVLPRGDALVLDTRNWKPDSRGVITTDVLDLGGDGVLTRAADVSDLTVAVAGALPKSGNAMVTEARTGTTFFQAPGTWTDWQPADGVIQPKGRYAQVRIRLTTSDADAALLVTALTLTYRLKKPGASGEVGLVSDDVQRIVRSPIRFGYERQDQADLQRLRKTYDLDEVIAGKDSEFEQLRALMRWVVTRPNQRPKDWRGGKPYPWDMKRVIKDEDGGTIYGHCMSYCEVMITAANAFGWQGRHWAIHGIRDTSHEVPEIWINELGKWVFFDPSLDTYYADRKTDEPLNLLEMHDIYVNFFLKPGEVQKRGRHHNEARANALRGTHPIRCVTGDWGYGKPWVWDWEFDHGYMTAGWMQLTPRNNWHSQSKPDFDYFGWGPDGYGGFPLYLDEKTPLPEPTEDSDPTCWYTRKRDFWWTLNQASFRLVRTGSHPLAVECGNSQPFFKRYLAKVDDGDWKPVDARFTWDLKRGKNRLEVICEDDFGKRGLSSVAVVRHRPNKCGCK